MKQLTGKSLSVLLNNVKAISIHPDRWILWFSAAIFTCEVTFENKTQAPAAAESDSRQILGGNSAVTEKIENSSSQYTLMCLSIGTPKNNKFSICSKWKIHYFKVSQN